MMARTQISLDPELQRRAQRRAAELGISFAEYVRGVVTRDLGVRRKKGSASLVFNLGASVPGTDVARRKDAMIGEAIAAARRKHTEEPLVTSDHVLVESWLLLNHRLGRSAAERFWEGLRSGAADVEPVTTADLEVAWAMAEDFPDQDFSIVDRTSFAVMLRLGLRRVATLDEDFAVFRFGPARRQAFEVVR